MAEETPTDKIVDDARHAADGSRTAARWFAAALGGIPGLAVVASIVRAPGEAGFDALLLSLGVAFTALGALLVLMTFGRVFSPVALEENDLKGFQMQRLGANGLTDYESLVDRTEALRDGVADLERRLDNATRISAEKQAAASRAQAHATLAEKEAKADGATDEQKARARESRVAAEAARASADAAASEEAGAKADLAPWQRQLRRNEALSKNAFLLQASDVVSARFEDARGALIPAVVLIAAGLVLLGLAPKDKSAAASPTLMTLTLNEQGQDALECDAPSVPALKVGGTDETPSVITLPTTGCEPRTLDFPTTEPAALGQATKVEAVEVPPAD